MSKKLIITGAAGMLGHDLKREFGGDHEIVPHDLTLGHDICDLEATRAMVRETQPAAIINGVAITNVDGCESDPDTAYKVNGVGARNVAIAAAECDVPLVHVSTDFVFSGDKGQPYIEYDPTGPLSVYGESKLWGELLVRDHCEKFFIVRTQWLYGAAGKNFVETIVGRAEEGHPLTVVDDQVGCPTSTVELARAIRAILAHGGYGIYHASGRGECSWFDFAKKACELAGVENLDLSPMPSSQLDRPAERPADSRMRNYHMELSFGDPMLPWDEALAEYMTARASA